MCIYVLIKVTEVERPYHGLLYAGNVKKAQLILSMILTAC